MKQQYIIHGPKPIIPLTNDSFGKILFESLMKYKNLPFALTDGVSGENASYEDILNKSCSLAIYLQKCGLKENDVVAIISENNLDYPCPILAALYLGIIVTPINPSYTLREVQNCINISRPKVAFCTKRTVDVILKIKKQSASFNIIILIDANERFYQLETLQDVCLKCPKEEIALFKPNELNVREHVAFIEYSSGTTGLPKGVLQTHRNYSTILAIFRDHRYNRQFEPGTQSTLGYLPFFHGYGLVKMLLSLIFAKRIVVLKQFEEISFLECLQNYKITELCTVPTIVNFLVKSPIVEKYDLSNIQELLCGASTLSKETEAGVKRRLNVNVIRQAYGMTETTFGVLIVPFNENRVGSSGKIVPYASMKVVDLKDGVILGPGKAGEIYVKGDMVMKGYARNEKATKEILAEDGWLATGDVGYYDKDEFFYIVDRKKELIKYKGYQVAPAELEALLLTHPDIKEACVVGVPDEVSGELPMAFIVLQPGKILTESEICDIIAKEVSPPKKLRGGVRFIDAMPKTPAGKILRRKLRELISTQKSQL